MRSYSSLQYVAKCVNQVTTDQQQERRGRERESSHGQQVKWTHIVDTQTDRMVEDDGESK